MTTTTTTTTTTPSDRGSAGLEGVQGVLGAMCSWEPYAENKKSGGVVDRVRLRDRGSYHVDLSCSKAAVQKQIEEAPCYAAAIDKRIQEVRKELTTALHARFEAAGPQVFAKKLDMIDKGSSKVPVPQMLHDKHHRACAPTATWTHARLANAGEWTEVCASRLVVGPCRP